MAKEASEVGWASRARWRDDRAKWDYVRNLSERAAQCILGNTEIAHDCVSIFLERALYMPEAQEWPFSAATEAKLAMAALRCAAAVDAGRKRRRKQEVLETELQSDADDEQTGEPLYKEAVCKQPGPEQLAILADTVEQTLIVMEQLTPQQQVVFVGIFLQRKSIAQLTQETGRSRQALYTGLHNIKARLQEALTGRGLTGAEIADLLNDLDRARQGQG